MVSISHKPRLTSFRHRRSEISTISSLFVPNYKCFPPTHNVMSSSMLLSPSEFLSLQSNLTLSPPVYSESRYKETVENVYDRDHLLLVNITIISWPSMRNHLHLCLYRTTGGPQIKEFKRILHATYSSLKSSPCNQNQV